MIDPELGLGDDTKPLSQDHDDILAEAKERFDTTLEWESYCRERYMQDFKFGHADNTNGYQWPDKIRIERDKEAKPWLTINKTRQHCLLIINEAEKNPPSMKARPTGDGATAKSALCYDAIFRGIEYLSKAPQIYSSCMKSAVYGGWGYFRIVADYKTPDTDEQEIYLKPIKDTMSVLFDPNCNQEDGSDADFCLIFDDMPFKEFKRAYPQFRNKFDRPPSPPLSATPMQSWIHKDTIRVAEYMRRIRVPDKLYTFVSNGEKVNVFESEIPKPLLEKLANETTVTKRDSYRTRCQWFLIIGDEIVQEVDFPGTYIPVIRVVPEEYVINERLDRPGHVRALRDPQRMYNYWATAATEYTALQTKTPWLAAKEAIEGQVDLWATSNLTNPAVLPFNAFNEDGNPNPVPQKVPPPVAAPAYLQGMQAAMQDMTFVSGQYQSMFGEPSNERSGTAINQRQQQGDTSTYHYISALASAIRHAGVVIMDMIPYVYDTKRVIFALQPDGSQMNMTLDPDAQQHYQEEQEAASIVLNPKMGKYQVQADIGPDWGTRREETFNALTLILTQAPQFANMIGDLLFRSADFDLAEEAAERLKRAVPPAILGTGPTVQEQQLTQKLQEVTTQSQKLTELSIKNSEENAKLRVIIRDLQANKTVDSYGKETDRLKVLLGAASEEEMQDVVKQLVLDVLSTSLPAMLKDIQNGPSLQAGSILSPAAEISGGGNSGGAV